VIALDAATGKMIWQYSHKPAEGTRNPCCGNLTRGVAILGDKLFLAALDARMIALDAKTGKELWNKQIADYKQQYAMTVAPIVVKDKVITGVAGGEHGVRGFLAAYDVNTGKEVWRFNTVPGPEEPGYETWLGKDGKPSDSYLHAIWTHSGWCVFCNPPAISTERFGSHRPGSSRSATRLDRHSGRLRFRTLRSYVDQVMADIVTAADGKVILPSGNSRVRATMRPEFLLFIRRSPGCIPVSRCHCARRR
jgi:hypothetical protein